MASPCVPQSLALSAKLNGAARVLLSPMPSVQVPRARGRGSCVVRASVSVLDEAERELQRKSMAELRAMAKSRGLRGDTKAELVEQLLLSGAASLSAASPRTAAAAPPAPAAELPFGAEAMVQLLEQTPLPQLREIARERGSRSSTRADILRDLRLLMSGQPLPKPTPPPAPIVPPPSPTPASPPAPAAAAAAAQSPPAAAGGAVGAREKELLGKGLAELRQLARAQGVRGDTKAQIVAALLATPVKAKPPSPPAPASTPAAVTAPPAAAPPKPAAPKPAAPKPAAPKPAAAAGGEGKGKGKEVEEKSEAVKALEAMEMGELRYLAKERGLKGETKEELVKVLADGPPPSLGFIEPPPSAPRRRRMPKFRAPLKDDEVAAAAASDEKQKLEAEQKPEEQLSVVVAEGEGERAEEVLPPFLSDAAPETPSPAPVLPPTPEEMAEEVVRLRQAVAGMRGAVEEEARRVRETSEEEKRSKYIRSAVIGGVGLALLPLLLPALISNVRPPPPVVQPAPELAGETSALLQSLLAAESSSLQELQALVPLIAPDLDDAARKDRAAQFCDAIPAGSRSAQAERFCSAVTIVKGQR